MAHVKPLQNRQADINKLNPKYLAVGSLETVKSDSVYRKIRSEKLALNDRDKDDLIDMILMQKDHRDFIQVVGTPFHVYIFSREQIDIIKYTKVDTIFLDATGSIVRKADKREKRIYYYAGVVQTPFNCRVCPVPLITILPLLHPGF